MTRLAARPTDTAETAAAWLRILGPQLPPPEREYRFHPARKWRFDFAWPAARLALEIDGGQWKPGGGRHNQDADREKLNAAACLGWRVLRLSSAMVEADPDRLVALLWAALHPPREG